MRLLITDYFADRYGGKLRSVAPGIEFVTIGDDGGFSDDLATVDAVNFSTDLFERNLHPALMRNVGNLIGLQWFHCSFVGVDHPIFRGIGERGVTVTNAPGLTAIPIAQYVLAMMLRHAKGLDQWAAAQNERAWRRVASDELTGRTVAIIGTGGIGTEVARLARAFGMRVLGMRRRPELPENVDALYPPEQLHDLLSEADYVVLACPLTKHTQGMMNAAALAAMKPTAYLINVARGPIVEETALLEALREGRIAGAALDVFDDEPLPSGSPLWDLPNVVVTPHNSGASPQTGERGAQLFIDNLRRFAAGEPLLNVVDWDDVVVV